MEFNYIADGIDAVIIDNFYDDKQLSEIMTELKWITKDSILVNPDQIQTAENQHGSMASKTGVFLESIFINAKHSALISHPMTNFLKPEVREKIESFNSLFRLLYWSDARTHLLSYYEDGGYYKPHCDTTMFTVLNWFHTEPRNFTGGDNTLFSFNSKKQADIEFKNNRVILIPGCCFHEVKSIASIKKELPNSGNGRYCNAIFLNMRGDPPQKRNQNDSN
jgi:hypothetical protein